MGKAVAGGVTAAVAGAQSPQERSLTLEQWRARNAWFYNFHFSRCLWMQCRESWARHKGTDLGGTKSSTCKTMATVIREQEVEMW